MGNNFNLTLSVILNNQDKAGSSGVLNQIEKLQNKIIEMAGLDKVEPDNPYETVGVYKYGRNNLHFSLINFLTHDLTYNSEFNCGGEVFENYRKYIDRDGAYQKYCGKVKIYLQKHINDLEENNFRADIRWIYTGDCQKSIDSISLQVYPDKIFVEKICELRNNFCEKLKEWRIGNVAGIKNELKAYPKKNECRFVLNVFRFMKIEDDRMKIKLNNIVCEINKEQIKEPLGSFNIVKFNLVESNPFLSNENPILDL